MAELPTLPKPIDNITLHELRTLVPELVRATKKGKRKNTSYAKLERPAWWPKGVPFTSPRSDPRSNKKIPWIKLMKKTVRRCYNYHGKAHMLKGPGSRKPFGPSTGKTNNRPAKKPSNKTVSTTTMAKPNVTSSERSPVKAINNQMVHSSYTPYRNGWSEKELLNFKYGSQGISIPRMGFLPRYGPVPPELFHVWKSNNLVPSAAQIPTRKPIVAALPTAEASTAEGAIPAEKGFVEVFICFFCEKDFPDRLYLQRHQEECPKRPSRPQAVRTPHSAFIINSPRRSRHRLSVSQYKRPEKSMFVKGIDLLPKRQAEAMKKQKSQEVDCIIIDLEETPVPKTSTTPRTPKSLMSQLSRDISPPPVNNKIVFDLTDNKENQNSDAESVCSRSDIGDDIASQQKSASLLSIDLCSPLGSRVKEHLMVNTRVPDKESLEDSPGHDEYCRTPVKNMFLDRLRNRTNSYPVTFRVYKHRKKHTHEYKFSKKAVKNFILRIETGLDANSRKLKKSMKKCSVVLHNMSVEEITRYVMFTRTKLCIPKKMISNSALLQLLTTPTINAGQPPTVPIFPEGPSILDNFNVLRQVLGLKTRQERESRQIVYNKQLSLSQMVSEQVNAEVIPQKAVVYKTILADCSGNRPELTPPSTPTKSPASERMSLFEAFTPTKNTCASMNGSPVMNSKMYPSLANSGCMSRLSRPPMRLSMSPHRPINVSTNGQVVYGGKDSRTSSPSCEKNEESPKVKTPSAMAVLNSLTHRPSLDSQKKCWNQPDGSQECATPSRRQSRRISNGNNSPSLPSGLKRRNSKSSVASDDVISISDSDGEDSGPMTRSKRCSTPDLGGNANKRRKISQDKSDSIVNNGASSPRSPSVLPKTPTVLFKCHLCHSEIAFKQGASDFIMQHFQQKHGVYNLHLVENTDQFGNSVVTIVEDTSRPRHLPPSPVPSNLEASGLTLRRSMMTSGNLPMGSPGCGSGMNRSPLARPPVTTNSFAKQPVVMPYNHPGSGPSAQVMQKMTTVGPGCFPARRQLNISPGSMRVDISRDKMTPQNSNVRPRTRRSSKDFVDIIEQDSTGRPRRSSRLCTPGSDRNSPNLNGAQPEVICLD